MLKNAKSKKTIYAPPNRTNQINQLQNELKESFKKLHLDSEKKTKTSNEYTALVSSIREEYEVSHKENQKLKLENQKLKECNNRQIDYNRRVIKKLPKRKRKYQQSVHQSSSSDSEDGNNYYYRYPKKKNKKQRSKVIYDDIDRENDYIEESPSDEDDNDEDNVKTQIEEKPTQKISKITKISKVSKKPTKKGITKSIKM